MVIQNLLLNKLKLYYFVLGFIDLIDRLVYKYLFRPNISLDLVTKFAVVK